ncbi:TetR/AcrR family transcriptional regulator [Nocardioides sp. zg-1308]|uniref:TetR/AcrR family transcriptional regulator n=1 Tax=Nocardioides sp. zg-1308 TaxID=2736253 RepID=UPI001555F4EE|nr:TetR/AcrR family transcriptional regulator [Nocardioides sp. zg-1308]NPD05914.1 TetR/AcrR family transcriptional regulator [Nocardioides sp. zg-1308]
MVGTTRDETSAARASRPSRPAAETRRRVLDAAAGLIDRLSYDAVTMDAVARASGVGRSTIYRHWPSRRLLVLEAFTHKTDKMTAVTDTGDTVADLRTYLLRLAWCLDFGGAASVVSGLVSEAVQDEEFARMFRATMVRERRRAFIAILLRGQERGQVRADLDVSVTVDALYGAVHHRLLVTRKPIDERFVSALVDVVAAGFAPR